MKVLVACEFSGVVRRAFNAVPGCVAYSCDVLPCDDDNSQWHYRCDVRDILHKGWDLMIAHPPCTYFTVAAAWALSDPDFVKYPGVGYHLRVKQGTLTGEARRKAQTEQLEFVRELYNAPIPHIAIENPVGQLSTLWRKPDQIVQPWYFGDDASKSTCLWLKNLPPLTDTNRLPGDSKTRRANQTPSGQNNLPPSSDRWKLRSTTYPGIASAMAQQWGQS